MVVPTPIEFSPLVVAQFERAFALRIREALPKGNGEFRPIPGRKLQELGKGARRHGLIVSRVDDASQYPERRPCCLWNPADLSGLAFSGLTIALSRGANDPSAPTAPAQG